MFGSKSLGFPMHPFKYPYILQLQPLYSFSCIFFQRSPPQDEHVTVIVIQNFVHFVQSEPSSVPQPEKIPRRIPLGWGLIFLLPNVVLLPSPEFSESMFVDVFSHISVLPGGKQVLFWPMGPQCHSPTATHLLHQRYNIPTNRAG